MTVPVVFAFDNNMLLPATVCISSLLRSAKSDTFYDIFILYSGAKPRIECEEKFKEVHSNLRITYRSVGDTFKNAYEIRGITAATYYRLLASELIPEYNKIIYSDVDVIFRMDLTDAYNTNITDSYLAAVPAPGIMNTNVGKKHLKEIGINNANYVCGGFLLMNLQKIREDGLSSLFKSLAAKNYKYQDQDVINIACQGKIVVLPRHISMGVSDFFEMEIDGYDLACDNYTNDDIREKSNIHFNGQKPWKDFCPNFDIWWEHYRKSPAYDSQFYFKFFYNKLESLDKLTLLKRIKILIRYFVYGRKKDI